MSISHYNTGTRASGTASPISVAYPSVVSGNILLLLVMVKYSDVSISTPSGWAAPSNSSFTGGQGTAGNDSGILKVAIFTKTSDGTETGNVSVTLTGGTLSMYMAIIIQYQKTTGTWEVVTNGGSDNSAGTSWSVTAGGDPGVMSGDMVVAMSGINGNVATNCTSQLVTSTGVTYGSMVERVDDWSSSGSDGGIQISEHPASSGSSSAAPVFTATFDTSGTNTPAGATVIVRLREASTTRVISVTDGATVGESYTLERIGGPRELSVSDGVTVGDTPTVEVAKTITQAHFRIRSDDSQTINADAGWAANLDTNTTMDAGKAFRIRFEVEESGTSTNTFKLQFRKNGGTWTDLVATGGVSTPAVIIVTSTQYADNAATTNILSGSAKTFEAGEGKVTLTTPSHTLSNEHTEIEYALMIMGLYDNRAQNVAGDVFEFRINGSSDGGLSGQIPSITTTMPFGYIGGTFPESPGRTLVVDGNKNLYYITEPAESGGLFTLIKSANGGSTWTLPDVANSPTSTDLESVDATYDSVNKCIHISHKGSGSSNVYYHRFRTSDHATNPDTWQIVDETVTASVAQSDQATAIQHRSDNTVVCFYRKTNGAAENMLYKIRSSGGSWGSEQTLDAESNVVFGRVGCVIGASDKIHIFYNDWTNGILYHRSLSSADSLSGRESVATGIGTGSSSEKNVVHPVYWDDAGNEKIMVAYRDDATGNLKSAVVTNDGTPETPKTISDSTVEISEAGSKIPLAFLAQHNKDTYALFVYTSDFDLYRDKSSNDGGWGTDVSQLSNVELDFVVSTVFTHSPGNGGNTVLGYVYEDSTTLTDGYTGGGHYAEYTLSSGYNVSVTDGATIGESVSVSIPNALSINISDGITVAESVSLKTGTITLSVTDDCAIGETNNSKIGTLSINITDGVSVGESVSSVMALALSINITSGITVGESVNVRNEEDKISVTSGVSVGESVSVILSTMVVSVTDGSSIGESVSAKNPNALSVNVSDDLTIGESVSAVVGAMAPFVINVTDDISIGEIISVVLASALNISVTDGSLVDDQVSAKLQNALSVNITDGVSVGDIISCAMPGPEIVSVSDDTNVQDIISVAILNTLINVSDGILLSDYVSVSSQTLSINILDGISVEESQNLYVPFSIDITDTLSVNDVVQINISTIKIDVTDSITVDDIPSVYIPTPGLFSVNVSDNISVDDVPIANILVTPISVSDNISVNDVVISSISTESISVTDGSIIGDTIQLSIGSLSISVTDSSTVEEIVSVLLSKSLISVTDNVGVSDIANADISDIKVDTSDSISVGESTTGTISTLQVSVSDGVSVADSVAVLILGESALYINVTDNVSVDDTASVILSGSVISVSDSIGVGETTSLYSGMSLSVSDGIVLGDSVSLSIQTLSVSITDNSIVEEIITVSVTTSSVNVVDPISLGDQVFAVLSGPQTISISVTDGTTIGETLSDIISGSVISVSDNITVGESVTAYVATIATLNVSVTDNVSVGDVVQVYTQYHHVLQINNTVHDNITDGIATTQKQSLAINDTVHDHIADGLANIQNEQLVINSTVHDMTSGEPIVIVDILTIHNCIHTQTANLIIFAGVLSVTMRKRHYLGARDRTVRTRGY